MSQEFRMVGELSFKSPPCLYITWEIPFFFLLAKESGYSIESPEFPFGNCDYCLRLFTSQNDIRDNVLELKLHELSSACPGRDVAFEFGLLSRSGEEIRIAYSDCYREITASERRFYFLLSYLEDNRDLYFPDGTVFVFCSVRLCGPSNGGCRKSTVSSPFAVGRTFRKGGKLSFGTPPFLHVTWRIPYFYRMAKGTVYSLQSPEFSFAGRGYCLRLFSTAKDRNARFKLVNLNDAVTGRDVSYEVFLKSRAGEEISLNSTYTYIAPVELLPYYIARSDLDKNRDSYFTNRLLTVFCFVRLKKPISDDIETSEKEEELGGLKDIVKLQSDYRQLLQKGAESDANFVVCGKEFRAHRCVLRARSPVFDAMFGHDTAEKKTGQVVISDMDPDSFGDFLKYLYTGCFEADLSDDNAFRLYQAADKYDVPTLRSECVAHMLRYLSVDSLCNFIKVALRHQEEDLLTPAVTFFRENRADIIVTVKWKEFLNDNDTDVGAFLIKAGVGIEHCEE